VASGFGPGSASSEKKKAREGDEPGRERITGMRRVKLAPSILTADFTRLGDEVRAVVPYVDWFHLDVMDGHYVPNLTFGPTVVEAVRDSCDLPLHVHLMIEDPVGYAARFAEAGADRISFHPEVVDDVEGAIAGIRDTGAGVGIAIHPDVPTKVAAPHLDAIDVALVMTVRPGFGGQSFLGEVMPKLREVKDAVEGSPVHTDIEVDGGVNLDTVEKVLTAGADIVVAGSAIFDGVDPAGAAKRMRDKVDALAGVTG
jgi:ribulose-phosphate 3-epimerase